jgi:hydrogenase maturation protease
MNRALVDKIAAAVLYEGYILYPYRPALKNRQRWTFGGVYPPAYSQAQGGTDACTMQTECLVRGGPNTTLSVSVRFLHLVARLVGEFAQPIPEWPDAVEPPFRVVEALWVGNQVFHTWQEAVEREIELEDSTLAALVAQYRQSEFVFEAAWNREPLSDSTGAIVGLIVRQQDRIEGLVQLGAVTAGEGLFRVSVTIQNRTPCKGAESVSRDQALMRSLVSTHTILGVRHGEFVSLLDPPEPLRDLAAGCHNVGTWPVLVGTDGEKDTVLSSPIILYDYPQIAPESPGDLFDGTEIDEILSLRIMALTDAEKQAMVAVDQRARSVLERTEALGGEQLMGLHGAIRGLRPIAGERGHG